MAVNTGPIILKVFILIPIIPSNNCIQIIINESVIKYGLDTNINNPIAARNNAKLLDIAYLALVKLTSFCDFDFR